MSRTAQEKREFEREDFIKQMKSKIFIRTEKYSKAIQLEIVLGIGLHTDFDRGTFPTLTLVTSGDRREGNLLEVSISQIKQEVETAIQDFARIPEEARYLKFELAQQLTASYGNRVHSALTTAEMDPEREKIIFNGRRRTEECGDQLDQPLSRAAEQIEEVERHHPSD